MMFGEARQSFSRGVAAARCSAFRSSLIAGGFLPNIVGAHSNQCPVCERTSSRDVHLAAAFSSERATGFLAPPGLVNAVVDGLGIRLPGDTRDPLVAPFPRVERFQGAGRTAIAMSTAVVIAAATRLVVGRRKRSQLAV